MNAIHKNIILPKRNNTPMVDIHIKIYAQNKLGDRHVIILIPGGPGNDMSMYDDPNQSIAQMFFEAADVVLFDPRSCGNSGQSDTQHSTLSTYIDDIEAIRQQLIIPTEKLYLFGQSYGSIAALGYAIRYPQSLKKLLLIGAAIDSSFIKSAQTTLDKIGSPQQIEFAQKLWTGTFNGSAKEIKKFYHLMSPLYSYTFTPGESPLEIGYNLDVMNYGWSHFLHEFDYKTSLGEISCEVLILWGQQEWLFPRSHITYLEDHIKNAKAKTYKNCMHMLWIDQWNQFKIDSLNFFGNINI